MLYRQFNQSSEFVGLIEVVETESCSDRRVEVSFYDAYAVHQGTFYSDLYTFIEMAYGTLGYLDIVGSNGDSYVIG